MTHANLDHMPSLRPCAYKTQDGRWLVEDKSDAAGDSFLVSGIDDKGGAGVKPNVMIKKKQANIPNCLAFLRKMIKEGY